MTRGQRPLINRMRAIAVQQVPPLIMSKRSTSVPRRPLRGSPCYHIIQPQDTERYGLGVGAACGRFPWRTKPVLDARRHLAKVFRAVWNRFSRGRNCYTQQPKIAEIVPALRRRHVLAEDRAWQAPASGTPLLSRGRSVPTPLETHRVNNPGHGLMRPHRAACTSAVDPSSGRRDFPPWGR